MKVLSDLWWDRSDPSAAGPKERYSKTKSNKTALRIVFDNHYKWGKYEKIRAIIKACWAVERPPEYVYAALNQWAEEHRQTTAIKEAEALERLSKKECKR
jgi:hypothetical protein